MLGMAGALAEALARWGAAWAAAVEADNLDAAWVAFSGAAVAFLDEVIYCRW